MKNKKIISENKAQIIEIVNEQIELYLKKYFIGKTNANNNLMNIDELSDYLKIPKSTLYSYTKNKKIPFVKKGKHLIFDRQKINNWLEEGDSNRGDSKPKMIQIDTIQFDDNEMAEFFDTDKYIDSI